MSLEETDPVGWLSACEQIRQLASRYAIAMGHKDIEGLADLFVADVRVGRDESGRVREGRDALAADFARQLEPIEQCILHVTNQVVDVADATSASGVVSTRGEINLGGEWIVQLIEYHDSYECREGRWLFVRRHHRLWYGAPIGTSPVGLAPANWPASATGTGDLW